MVQELALAGGQADAVAGAGPPGSTVDEGQQGGDGRKPWYLSKGFVGPLVSAILFSLRNLGIVDLDDQTVLSIVYQSGEFVGIIFGMAGRAMAKKRLSLGPVPCRAKGSA
jgi:hypothetical protein